MTICLDVSLLNKLPGAIGFKDINSTYLGGNKKLAAHMGYNHPRNIIGLSDQDIRSKMVHLADKFIANDKHVMKHGEQQHIDVGLYPDGNYKVVLATKKPLYDECNNIVGVAFSRTDLNSSLLHKMLSKNDFLHCPGYFSIGHHYGNYKITNREAETLFFILRGYSAKEIALRLNLSRKTIEYYIQQLKNKFSCNKRSELIEKCISFGYFYNIPTSILST